MVVVLCQNGFEDCLVQGCKVGDEFLRGEEAFGRHLAVKGWSSGLRGEFPYSFSSVVFLSDLWLSWMKNRGL